MEIKTFTDSNGKTVRRMYSFTDSNGKKVNRSFKAPQDIAKYFKNEIRKTRIKLQTVTDAVERNRLEDNLCRMMVEVANNSGDFALAAFRNSDPSIEYR